MRARVIISAIEKANSTSIGTAMQIIQSVL